VLRRRKGAGKVSIYLIIKKHTRSPNDASKNASFGLFSGSKWWGRVSKCLFIF